MRATSRIGRALVAGLSMMAAARCLADEGRIPIYQPTTITQPGSYVLTSDISVSSGVAITIAAPRVALDLNGHAVSVASTAGPGDVVIRLAGGADDVWISNGRLIGGLAGLDTTSSGPMSIRIERLTLTGQGQMGIFISGIPVRNFELLDNDVIGSGPTPFYGLTVQGSSGVVVSGRVERNRTSAWGYGLTVGEGEGVQVRDNVDSGSLTDGMVVTGYQFGPLLVTGNTVTNAPIGIVSQWIIEENVVRGNANLGSATAGIIATDDALVVGNVVTNAAETAGRGGLEVSAAMSLVERNVVESTLSAACGLAFYPSYATQNAYRDNMLRNNPGGAVCIASGASATDAGGNVP